MAFIQWPLFSDLLIFQLASQVGSVSYGKRWQHCLMPRSKALLKEGLKTYMPKAKKREKAAKVFMIGFLLFVEPLSSCMQNCRYRSSPKTQTVGPYAVAFFSKGLHWH